MDSAVQTPKWINKRELRYHFWEEETYNLGIPCVSRIFCSWTVPTRIEGSGYLGVNDSRSAYSRAGHVQDWRLRANHCKAGSKCHFNMESHVALSIFRNWLEPEYQPHCRDNGLTVSNLHLSAQILHLEHRWHVLTHGFLFILNETMMMYGYIHLWGT